MTPLLALALVALTPTTHPATINPTPTTEAPTTMAQGQSNTSFPIRHPNQHATDYAAPGPAHRGAAHGYPTIHKNPLTTQGMTPVEHTNRPR